MATYVFWVAPLHATPEEILDWLEAKGITRPVLHDGPDGSIRGGGYVVETNDPE